MYGGCASLVLRTTDFFPLDRQKAFASSDALAFKPPIPLNPVDACFVIKYFPSPTGITPELYAQAKRKKERKIIIVFFFI